MKIEQLPGQYVWIETGTPIVHDTTGRAPRPLTRYQIVLIDRVTSPTDTRPQLAIWRDAEGEYGVEARSVVRHVMSLPPSGRAWIIRAVEWLKRRLHFMV